jgi:HAD superfamily hydrolase (TIGR01509 family)
MLGNAKPIERRIDPLPRMKDLCVIFDSDGTLVDSERLCNQAFLDLLPDLNEPCEALVERYRGKKLSTILSDLEARIGCSLPEPFEQRYRERVGELFSQELGPTPGVIEMLNALPFASCVASGGPALKIRHALEVSGLSSYFGSRVFSSYEVGSWKPDPGLFLYAAEAMGFMPRYCAVIEDSDVGIQAALAAGMKAFHYLPEGSASTCVGAVAFSDMSELSMLLAQAADQVNAQS